MRGGPTKRPKGEILKFFLCCVKERWTIHEKRSHKGPNSYVQR